MMACFNFFWGGWGEGWAGRGACHNGQVGPDEELLTRDQKVTVSSLFPETVPCALQLVNFPFCFVLVQPGKTLT